jgi:hypothetical protein
MRFAYRICILLINVHASHNKINFNVQCFKKDVALRIFPQFFRQTIIPGPPGACTEVVSNMGSKKTGTKQDNTDKIFPNPLQVRNIG